MWLIIFRLSRGSLNWNEITYISLAGDQIVVCEWPDWNSSGQFDCSLI